jgi:hypothetical protein
MVRLQRDDGLRYFRQARAFSETLRDPGFHDGLASRVPKSHAGVLSGDATVNAPVALSISRPVGRKDWERGAARSVRERPTATG